MIFFFIVFLNPGWFYVTNIMNVTTLVMVFGLKRIFSSDIA